MLGLAVAASVLALVQANVATAPLGEPSQPPGNAQAKPVITNPDWLRRPTAADMVWPGGAYYAHVRGRVEIDCVVNAKGRLEQCVVLTEEPKGWGFGDAAIATAANFRMKPVLRDGEPVGGARIRIPIIFWPD